MRFLLGDVEPLLLSEMGLSHPGHGVSANLRNAVARVRRLHSVRSGALRVKKPSLAERTATGVRGRARDRRDVEARVLRAQTAVRLASAAGDSRLCTSSTFASLLVTS